MTPSAVDRDWLRALRAAATQPPLRPRVPLWAGESVIGSVEPDFLHQIALQPIADGRHQLLKEERPESLGWRLMGDVTTSLNRVAAALHAAGLAALLPIGTVAMAAYRNVRPSAVWSRRTIC